jgi:oligopeptide transport system substrate-binding protein
MAWRSTACVLAALLTWLAGCAQDAPPHAALRRGLRGDIATLDPQKAGDELSKEVIRDLFEGLTTEGDDGRAQSALAVSWTISEDLLTYTFRLRDDARWSNGDPVVATDVLRGLRRAVDPATASPSANILRPI